jgi:hypothetical protein
LGLRVGSITLKSRARRRSHDRPSLPRVLAVILFGCREGQPNARCYVRRPHEEQRRSVLRGRPHGRNPTPRCIFTSSACGGRSESSRSLGTSVSRWRNNPRYQRRPDAVRRTPPTTFRRIRCRYARHLRQGAAVTATPRSMRAHPNSIRQGSTTPNSRASARAHRGRLMRHQPRRPSALR